jgi:hypothetical protein
MKAILEFNLPEDEKDTRFTWCTCGCHLTKVSDIQRMKKEGTWKTSSSTLVETVD